MDIDFIVSIIIFAALAFGPGLFKLLLKNQKQNTSSAKDEKPSGIFKITEGIQQFFKELERQAAQKDEQLKKEQRPDDTSDIWAQLAESESKEARRSYESSYSEAVSDSESDVTPPLPPAMEHTDLYEDRFEKETAVKEPLRRRDRDANSSGERLWQGGRACAQQKRCVPVFRSDPLQNALIWSEILKKPLSIRND